MRRGELRETMKKMYARQDTALERSKKLEAEVMAHYRDVYANRRSWTAMLSPRNRIVRYAVGTLAVVALTGVACQLPTETPVDMGHHVQMRFAPTGDAPDGPASSEEVTLEVNIQAVRPGSSGAEIAGAEVGGAEVALEGGPSLAGLPFASAALQAALVDAGAEKIEFRLRGAGGKPRGGDILVWGQHIRRADVQRLVEQHVAHAQGLTYEISPLTGTISESVGKRVSRRLFDIDVRRETAEELRAAILEQLAEQGFVGSVVDVQDDANGRTIQIETGTPDGSRKVAEEVIIEQPDN